ncbi:hypothetical protein AB4305_09060 [Nocardia sp. 2YAB30]|uniref:hypothetical protein n=1 Tax=unclassified Nocardia TaxID=2637762 RepID=UPI003F96F1BF
MTIEALPRPGHGCNLPGRGVQLFRRGRSYAYRGGEAEGPAVRVADDITEPWGPIGVRAIAE